MASLLSGASTLAIAGMLALGGAPAALAAATTTSATSTPPAYCNTSTSTEGYFVTTDTMQYMPGQIVNFCLTDNTRTPLFLVGSHPWRITDATGTVLFTPASTSPVAGQPGASWFTDFWNMMLSSTTATTTASSTMASSTTLSPGTYRVVFPGFPGSPFASFSVMSTTSTGTTSTSTATSTGSMGTTTATSTGSMGTTTGSTSTTTSTSTASSTTGTGTTTPGLGDLIVRLEGLQISFPNFIGQIQDFINQLTNMGTPPGGNGGNMASGTIDQNGQTYTAGGSIDFGGRHFNHEEKVTVTLNGQTVATAHADGGGNFSTGRVSLPSTPGTYTYSFMGASGDNATATIILK